MRFLISIVFCVAAYLFAPISAEAAEPSITIQTPTKKISFTRSELLSMAEKAPLEVLNDPAYKEATMRYRVVPLSALIAGLGIKPGSIILFKCLDGFSAPLATELLLSTAPGASRAYVAIEETSKPWPKLKEGADATAGPFYLVWKDPKLSKVGPEQWPYQLASFEVKPPLREAFPDIFPAKSASKTVEAGFQSFVKNCFVCHTMNLAGESRRGPDLNVPHNPTEYFREAFLRKLIRDPQNLRHWPDSKMNEFLEKNLSDAELSNLIVYLKHMAGRKVAVPK